MKYVGVSLLSVILLVGFASAQEVPMKPFTMDWRDNSGALVDLSFLLDAPAGKAGFVRAHGGKLVKPNGVRFRIWGLNVTGSCCFPSKEDAPIVADHLARFGINCVRFHFLDSNWSASVFVKGRDDTRALDPQQLDKLDFFVWQLKRRGIYTNINLNVGRNYRKGDGVRDYEYLGLAKVVNYFDERVQMLHREYAKQLLTHRNPYTKSQYREEPAVAIVELVNENSIVEAWFSDRLLGRNTGKRPGTWADFTPWYAEQLTKKYNAWLSQRLSAAELEELREIAGVKEDDPIPRLTAGQFADAPEKRFHLEAQFYMGLEREYFDGMYRYLKQEVGVKSLIAGTSDHNHWKSGYPLLCSTSRLDVVDGHVYWQHPRYLTDPKTKKRTFSIPNTPMVNDPLNSTVVQLSRSAVTGRPYTVSETNHPFPNEYACEGVGILAAYASFHDWDGIFFYTFEHKDPDEWQDRMPGHFEIRPDPVKMANLAAGALMFLRSDVRPATETIYRSYSRWQVRESIRLPSSARPYFTPGFALSIPLKHSTRITGFDKATERYREVSTDSPFVSDTGDLIWHCTGGRDGRVTIETERTQALIGYLGRAGRTLRNISAELENEFCSVMLCSLDGEPISKAGRLLLVATARSANTGMKWNQKRTSLLDWGIEPTVIEPVKGKVTLRDIAEVSSIEVILLDGAGRPLGPSIAARKVAGGYEMQLGEPATTWYLIRIER
ncbi:MAG: hypothetical protein JSU70_22275 [Phycisphaerales bacterium]|nr:MAG: hypothetical protein JSU70_22275 [Phycisphaerales bacterium]